MTKPSLKLTALAIVITLFVAVLGGAATTALLEDDEVANASFETGNVGNVAVGNTQTNDVCAGNVGNTGCDTDADLGLVGSQPFSPQIAPATKGR